MTAPKVSGGNGKSLGILICCMFVAIVSSQLVTACPVGYYGPACRYLCSNKCLSMECHNITGACLDGCQAGYTGENCQNVCRDGYYGDNCTQTCATTCPNNKCDHVTGSCLEECPPGTTGHNCDQACRFGRFGPGCNQTCPPNCARRACDPKSGYCLEGCRGNYWGSDCSLQGEFKENPVEKKGLFYKHLSAESRSVLLYILMNQYDMALEKAQAEIEASLKIRNELSALIGG
ncbi:multiple epidermal growth factor-like domains 10 [Plakobranchus ocellatus]|uniref:Multiple epidermal growth factor-like domains 10 n=1 Tax=Plakobranchus ocellatus TaxID=259542 RepID=A0AAV3XTQ9_9GAST|nr:multiple epidermal growth factor-like domains 10 [Plakobranchus ocellatus]